MGPIEIIYNGYTGERQDIDTAETNEAADNLMEMIKSLLPDSGRMSFTWSVCTLRNSHRSRDS